MFRPANALTADTVKGLYAAGLAAIAAGQTSMDLGDVTAVDSTAVAALVGWQRAALQKGVKLDFFNLPDSLQSLTALYGVASLLPTAATLPATSNSADLPHH